MSETSKRDQKLVEYLNEAYATERRLEIALQAHIAMTPHREYKARLREHLKETKGHARSVAKRIKQLGGDPDVPAVPGPEAVAKGLRAAKTAVQQAAAAAQGPLHVVRGTGQQERMLKNARTEYQDEAEEIATYRAIEALAKGVGDKETAKLARDIQREEKSMSDFLGKIIDQLALDVVHDEVPVAEIHGPSARRVASKPTSAGSSARATSPRSTAAAKSGGSSRGRTASKPASSSRNAAAKRTTSPRSTAAKSGGSSRGSSRSGAKRS
jgi:ferritin-like metal-binding protein YciE